MGPDQGEVTSFPSRVKQLPGNAVVRTGVLSRDHFVPQRTLGNVWGQFGLSQAEGLEGATGI